ncbi:MAG: HAD family hydrolase [Bacteroidales bacterium]|nr:HAD family hydrolase [Bacteroidales bacterium]MCF8343431.1 HAD family hydrolase [Bacteroidales bacterium]MCF8349886.1 HAD family hydrolase [Bacteroidales bacterium]MCF8376767.1 HAD family hydrolase [Bacteroidales bacterium]
MSLKHFHIDKNWSLFLDRDGVINKRLRGDYVKRIEEFDFLPGVLNALPVLAKKFNRIVVVSNQQGIGKGLMTEEDLQVVHDWMMQEIGAKGGRIDQIYYCTALAAENNPCRKPNPGMALQAKTDFPEINLSKSIMAGDSHSDMLFGKNLGMLSVFINSENMNIRPEYPVDYVYESLCEFAREVDRL